MKAYVSRVLKPEEYSEMSDDELFDIIKRELYVNEANADTSFKHKKTAEYLERAIYVCPQCGLSTFESHNDVIECKKCGIKVRYLPTKELRGEGFDFPFPFVLQWYEYQSDFVNSLDVTQYTAEPLYTERATLKEVIPCEKKMSLCKDGEIKLFGDRISIDSGSETILFTFDETTAVTVLGRNKLNVYHGGKIYQFKGNKRFNALKYVHIFNRYKNIKKGELDGKFLGL
jgi:DNA-directed RNA polymerase subunit RPC12/RpoP